VPAPTTLAPPAEPHPSLPLAAAIGALAILLASLMGGRLLIEVLSRFDWPLLVYVALLTTVGYGPSVAWCWHVSRRWGSRRLGADVGLRFRWSDAGWGPVIWISALVVQIAVAALILAFDVPLTSNTERVSDIDADRAYVIALAITAVVAAPIVEEMVFRGVVMRGLRARVGGFATVALQAVFFGAAHFDPVRGAGNIGLVMVLSAVGGAFGLGAYLLRRIGPTILAHAIFNGVVLIIVLTGANENSDFELGARRSCEATVGECAVVDQSYVAEPHRDQQARSLVDLRNGLEGVVVDDDGVLERREGSVAHDSADDRLDAPSRSFT
jgi:hypothetical protein